MDSEFQTFRLTVVMPSGSRVRHTVELEDPSWSLMEEVANAFGGTLHTFELVADHMVPA